MLVRTSMWELLMMTLRGRLPSRVARTHLDGHAQAGQEMDRLLCGLESDSGKGASCHFLKIRVQRIFSSSTHMRVSCSRALRIPFKGIRRRRRLLIYPGT